MRQIIFLIVAILIIFSSNAYSQWAPLDTTKQKWFTVDNTPNFTGTSANWEVDRDSSDGYYEKPPNSVASGQPGPGWFTNTGGANVGPDHRRTPFTDWKPIGCMGKIYFRYPDPNTAKHP